ncbi:hypothetical protein C0J52_10759 [Blattella germanica]|nr:hypothetical protein C0J52_10759 [Blattella germanica]
MSNNIPMSAPKKRKVESTSDPNVLMRWFDEISEVDGDTTEDDSDGEEDQVFESDHDSASEQEVSEDEEEGNEVLGATRNYWDFKKFLQKLYNKDMEPGDVVLNAEGQGISQREDGVVSVQSGLVPIT